MAQACPNSSSGASKRGFGDIGSRTSCRWGRRGAGILLHLVCCVRNCSQEEDACYPFAKVQENKHETWPARSRSRDHTENRSLIRHTPHFGIWLGEPRNRCCDWTPCPTIRFPVKALSYRSRILNQGTHVVAPSLERNRTWIEFSLVLETVSCGTHNT